MVDNDGQAAANSQNQGQNPKQNPKQYNFVRNDKPSLLQQHQGL